MGGIKSVREPVDETTTRLTVTSGRYVLYPVCQPTTFSNPYVNPRKTTANTNQRNTSNVPVNARTLKIYDNDASTSEAT